MAIKIRLVGTLLSALFALPSLSPAADIHFRLSPSIIFLNTEEANLSLAGWREELKARAEAASNMKYMGGEAASLRLGTAFEAEVRFSLGSRLGIGVGGGYFFSELDEEKTQLAVVQDGIVYQHVRPLKLSAYPVRLCGYLFFPLSSRSSVYLLAGGGYIQAKYTARQATKKEEEVRYSYIRYETAKAGRATVHGGIGFGYDFDSNFGIFFESTFQAAKISEFRGQDTELREGSLFFFEELVPDLDFWQSRLEVRPEAPEGPEFRAVRKATIDFGGFSAKMGIQLKF